MEMMATRSVVEYDSCDMSFVKILIKIKRGTQSLSCLATFTLHYKFPSKPPHIEVKGVQQPSSAPHEVDLRRKGEEGEWRGDVSPEEACGECVNGVVRMMANAFNPP